MIEAVSLANNKSETVYLNPAHIAKVTPLGDIRWLVHFTNLTTEVVECVDLATKIMSAKGISPAIEAALLDIMGTYIERLAKPSVLRRILTGISSLWRR